MTVKDKNLKTRSKRKRQHPINIMFSSPYIPVVYGAKSFSQGNSSVVRNPEESTPNVHLCMGKGTNICPSHDWVYVDTIPFHEDVNGSMLGLLNWGGCTESCGNTSGMFPGSSTWECKLSVLAFPGFPVIHRGLGPHLFDMKCRKNVLCHTLG